MPELQRVNSVFNAISDMKHSAEPGSIEDFDFFLTVGDNLYPFIAKNPHEFEFDVMLRLFSSRPALKNLPIYPVRGNHDCFYKD